jgi:hypothetical protein
MPIITGSDSEFGRLVAEEFNRRAQRVINLGQAAPDTDVDQPDAGEGDAWSRLKAIPTCQKGQPTGLNSEG